MAERTGLEFAYARRRISNLLTLQERTVPLYPLKTPVLPPTLHCGKGVES